MYQKTYFMPKFTGTFADTLAAFGLAVILREIYEQANGRWSGKNVRIRDAGPYYEIELPSDLQPEWVESCPFFAPARPIRTSKQPVSEIEVVWNLDDEWNKFRQFRDAQDKLKVTVHSQTDGDRK